MGRIANVTNVRTEEEVNRERGTDWRGKDI